MAYNHVTLVGRLCSNPELRRTGTGKAVTSFRLAVDRPTSEKQTDFLDIVSWERNAEFAERNFTKGQEILVDGEIQTRSWEDDNGNKRNVVEIKANAFRFVGTRADRTDAPSNTQSGNYAPIDDDDQHLPF